MGDEREVFRRLAHCGPLGYDIPQEDKQAVAWAGLHMTGLELKVAKLEAAQRWIPVSERLPEQGWTGAVAVQGTDSIFSTAGEWDGESWLMMHNVGEYQRHEPEFEDYGMTVTHWMPLPPAPENSDET